MMDCEEKTEEKVKIGEETFFILISYFDQASENLRG